MLLHLRTLGVADYRKDTIVAVARGKNRSLFTPIGYSTCMCSCTHTYVYNCTLDKRQVCPCNGCRQLLVKRSAGVLTKLTKKHPTTYSSFHRSSPLTSLKIINNIHTCTDLGTRTQGKNPSKYRRGKLWQQVKQINESDHN